VLHHPFHSFSLPKINVGTAAGDVQNVYLTGKTSDEIPIPTKKYSIVNLIFPSK